MKVTKQINNSSPLKGRPNKLGKVIKSAIPMLAMLGGGAAASIRNVSSSVNGRRLKSEARVYVNTDIAQQEQASAQDNAKKVKAKRSAFGAFSYAKKANENAAAEVAVNNSALAFLKDNNLLDKGDSIKATLSGNMLGRKTFASFCHNDKLPLGQRGPAAPNPAIDGGIPHQDLAETTVAQAQVMASYANKASCTSNGNYWHYTSGGNCTSSPGVSVRECVASSAFPVRAGGHPFYLSTHISGFWENANIKSIAGGTPANSAPTDISLTSTSVNQSDGTNATVGTLSTTDADGGDSHTYSLVSGAGDTNNGNFNISGSSLRANNATALSAGSYSVRVNTNDGTDDFAKQFTITVVDNVAPVFDSTPVISSITGTGATLSADLDEDGTVYYVVVANGASAPSVAEVKAGTGNGGSGQLASGDFTTSSTTGSEAFSGLANSTDYDIYVVAQDDEGSPNEQASVTKIDFTTIDDTAPVFDSTPTIGSITGTGATLSADLNEDGTVYYVVVANGASAPSVAEVKAGTGNGGSGQLASGDFTTSSTTGSEAFSGLANSTDYDIYVVAQDDEGSPNEQASVTKIDFSTIDDTAPVFDSTPTIGSITGTGATLSADLNEDGTVYYVVVANGASAPSVAEVKAGTGNGGSGQLASGDFTTSSTTGSEAFSGLSGSTAYDIYVVAQDDEGSPNEQVSVTKIDFTTIDSTAPTISAVTIPNSNHKVGDTVTATITVTSDSDDYTTGSGGISGTINGYALGSLNKTNDTTYTATFTITDGGVDVAAGSNIAVNFTLDDSSGNTSAAFTTAISQGSDAIYANLPDIDLTTDTNTIAEDGGVATLTATLSGSLNNHWPADITVNLAYTGTGSAGTDYSKLDSIVISSGSSSNTASLTSTADTLFDAAADETAIVDLSSLSVGNEGTTNQQTITITDAESAPTVTLSTGASSVAENGGTSVITAELSHATYENVTVNISYSGTATGGGTDYNTPSSSITINGGSTSANATTGITAVDDGDIDANETIIIDVSSVSGGGASESGTQQQTVTITDDEDGTAPTISAVTIPNSNHKVGDTVTATITVTSDSDDYTTGSGGISGTINGYALGSLSKTNDTTYTATFTVTDGGVDVAAGSNIAVNFTLDDSSGNTSAAFTTAISQGSDAIYANLPDVDLTTDTNTIAEDGGVATLTATLSGSLNNHWPADITVNLAYTGTGSAGTDYSKLDSIVITSGSSSNTASLTSTADTLFDAAADETAIVDISSLSVGNEGSTNQQTITITDAESAPTVTLSTASSSIAENGGTSVITAELSHATYENVTVNLTYSGTATNGGTDYNTPSSSITINGGSTSANATTGITAVDDGDIDANETIIIDVSSVSGGSASESGTQQQTVTITDDEDGTAPTFDTSPILSAITSSGATVAVDLDEDGSAYYLVVADGATVPTAAQVKAGVDYSGMTVLANGTINTTSTIGNSTISTLSDGSHYDIYVIAQDNFGNLQADGAVVRLDLSTTDILPDIASITISGSPADTDTSVDFDVVFADEVSNVSTDDFTANLVSGETNQPPAITGITGSGKNYTVSINTGVTIGDLRLDLNDSTNIIDENSNTPSAYTSGAEHTIDTNNVPTVTEATNSVGPFTPDEDVKVALDLTDLVIADGNDDALTLTLSVDNGLLFASDGNTTVSATTIAGSDEDGTTSITLTGLSADITSFFDDGERIHFQTDENDTSAVTLTISADDELEVGSAFTETLTITAINDAPTISGTPTTSIVDGNAYSFIPSANDIENDTPLVFSITNKPTWASFDTETGELSGNPTPAHVGITSDIVIRVEDPSLDGNDLAAFDVEIVASNLAPEISQGTSTLINMSEDGAPTAFSLSLDATDVNNDSLIWSIATQSTQGTAAASGGGNNKTISYIPNDNYQGNDSFVVAVSDGLLTDTITVNVVVASVNDLPSFSSSGTSTVAEDSGYSYNITATDLDDTNLTITATTKPNWLTLVDNGSGSASLTGTPTNADIGDNSITLKVTDDENGQSLQSFTITVTNTNDAPIISGTPATTIAEDSAYSFTPTVTDVDSGDTKTFSITGKPSWAGFSTATGSLTGTPNNDEIGTYSNIIITVTDSANASDSLTAFAIAVTNTNDAPEITGTPNTTVAEDSAYSFTPTVTDVDSGDTKTFSITDKPSWAEFSTATGALTGTPSNDDVGSDSNIIITVTDSANASDSLTAFAIAVTNTNDAPIISGTPSTTVAEDSAYSFTPTVTDVDSGDTKTFSITGKPSWAGFSTATGSLTGTPNNDEIGNYSNIIITVTDSANASDSLTAFAIAVTNTNDAPIISGTPATTIAEDSAYSFTPTVTDVDSGDTKTFSITGKPSWAEFSTATGALTGTPSNDDVGSDSNIIITVTDSANASVSLTAFTIEVTNTNDIAEGENQQLSLAEDSQINVEPLFSDVDGDELTFQVVTEPSHGEMNTLTTPWVYIPEANYNGEDFITVIANDGNVDSAAVTISFTITAVNDAPEAIDDLVSIELNQDNIYNLDVLDNDLDIDEDELSISAATASLGQVSIVDGQLQYVAETGFVGDVQLSYIITDGHDEYSEATVSLTVNGTNNVSAPELIVPEPVVVNANGLYTKVDLGIATAVDNAGKAIPVSLVDGITLFQPGNNLAYWQTIDNATGLSTIASQKVSVNPLVSLAKNQVVVEGAALEIEVILNGQAPSYPLEISYTISGSSDENDHNLVDGSINIESGSSAIIQAFITADADIEGDETLIITLSDELNLGAQAQQTIIITEENVAPEVNLSASQNNIDSIKFTPNGGDIIISAQVTDANVNDSVSINWLLPEELTVIEQDNNQVVIDASTLTSGVYQVSLTASDEGLLSQTSTLYLAVVAELPVLQDDVDTDGDLIPDSQEGYADSDSDGIPDYQDAIAECNVLPEQANVQQRFLVEGQPGVCLRKGSTVANSENGGIQLSDDDLSNSIGIDDEALNIGGIFDYIATGLPTVGQQYSLVLPQRQPIPAGAVYRKYNENSGWGEFVQDADNYLHSTAGEPGYCPPPESVDWNSGLTEGHWCVQLTLTDGGPNDDDGIANGTIVDPGGVAVLMSNNAMPIANHDSVSMLRNESIIIDVLNNDTDVDGDIVSLGVASAIFGEVSITADQQLSYSPYENFAGMDTITYSISDGNGGVANSTVTVEVRVNQAPVIDTEPQNITVDDHSSVTIEPIAGINDVDNDTLTITAASVDHGQITINADNSLTYTPARDYQGTAIVTYLVSDGENDPIEGSFNVTVTAYQSLKLESKSSGGSAGVGLLFMSLLLVLARSRKVLKLSYLAALLAAITTSSQANEQPLSGFFIGGGLNQLYSADAEDELNALTQGFDNVDSDASRLGWQLHLGYQFDNNWRVELGYHDLDNVEVTFDALPNAIDYQKLAQAQAGTGSGVALIAAYQWQLTERLALQPRLGLMHWSSDIYLTDINNTQLARAEDSDTDFVAGLALEYQLNKNWSMYALLQNYFFEDNVSSIGLGINYYFGNQSGNTTNKTSKTSANQQVTQVSTPKPVAVIAKPKDSDNDGIIDEQDQCPATAIKYAVDANGCVIMEQREVEMQVVLHFSVASSKIQAEDQQKIKALAEFIEKYQVKSLNIYGHTSAQGAAAFNKKLSQQRAQALLNQLHQDYGIDETIMTAIGKGEEALLDHANTAAAHQINRRVEISLKEILLVEKAR